MRNIIMVVAAGIGCAAVAAVTVHVADPVDEDRIAAKVAAELMAAENAERNDAKAKALMHHCRLWKSANMPECSDVKVN